MTLLEIGGIYENESGNIQFKLLRVHGHIDGVEVEVLRHPAVPLQRPYLIYLATYVMNDFSLTKELERKRKFKQDFEDILNADSV